MTLALPITSGQVSLSGVVDQHIMESTVFLCVLLFGYSLVGFFFLFGCNFVFLILLLYSEFRGVGLRKNLKLVGREGGSI